MHFGLFEGDVNDVYERRERCYQPECDVCRHFEGFVIARSVADVFDLTSRVSGPHFAGDVNDCRGFHIDWRNEVMSSF